MNLSPSRASLVVLLPLALACAKNDAVTLKGTWRGQWSSGTTVGDLEATFTSEREFGDMTVYDVSLVVTGAACPSGEDRGAGDRGAAFKIDDVRFVVRIPEGGSDDEGVFEFDGALNGARESDGRYALTSASCPACKCGMGTSGDWRLFR